MARKFKKMTRVKVKKTAATYDYTLYTDVSLTRAGPVAALPSCWIKQRMFENFTKVIRLPQTIAWKSWLSSWD